MTAGETKDLHTLGTGRYHLAEGPFCINNALFFVDVEGKRVCIHRVSGSDTPFECYLEKRIGFAAPTTDENILLIAQDDSLMLLDIRTSELHPFALGELFEHQGDVRFNDGKVDPSGEVIVAGSMHLLGMDPVGALFAINKQRSVTRLLDGLTISNGLDWSPDGGTFFHVDSPRKVIMAYDYRFNAGRPALSNERIAVDLRSVGTADNRIVPDGLAVDSAGAIWVAMWGEGAVRRYRPFGELTDRLTVPSPNLSSVAFGGPDLKTLFITSARADLGPVELERYPLSGSIFTAQVEICGKAPTRFKLD